MQETGVWSLGHEDPMVEEMATHSSILAWEIPWTERPGGYSPWDLKRMGYDLGTNQQQSKYEWKPLSSVQFSCSVVSDSLRPHELQHARPPCPSPPPGVHSDSRPSSPWCHPAWKPLTNHISKFLTTAEVYCPRSAVPQETRQPKMPSFLDDYTLLLVDSGDKSFQKHCTLRQDSRSLLKVCTYSYVTSRSNSHTLEKEHLWWFLYGKYISPENTTLFFLILWRGTGGVEEADVKERAYFWTWWTPIWAQLPWSLTDVHRMIRYQFKLAIHKEREISHIQTVHTVHGILKHIKAIYCHPA